MVVEEVAGEVAEVAVVERDPAATDPAATDPADADPEAAEPEAAEATNLEVAAIPNATRVREWEAANHDRPVSRVATRGGRTI